MLAPAPMGGLERVVQMLAVGQREAGHDVAVLGVVAPGPEPHPFFGPLERVGVQTLPTPVPDRSWLSEARALESTIRRVAPDIVHTHGYRPDVLAGAAARRLRLPLVSTAHGFTGGGLRNRIYEWLQVRSYRRGRHVIAVSRPLRDWLARRGVPRDRLHAVQNAWRADVAPVVRSAARAELGLDAESPVIGWVGRVSREKGADVAVEAMPHLDGVHLAMIGDGPMRPGLERRVAELGITSRVTWHGWVPRADRLLRAFDVIVLSSRTEGTPIIALEALAASVPLVATRVGGVPDIVRHGEEALLVPSGDSAALARAVRRTLDDRDGTLRRVEAGLARLEAEFGTERWLARHDRIYAQAMGGGEGAS